ncbi:hypothetical protein J6590_004833 [Homalodisca vitripennis]|nr:hypothetical protein J6590_004833 [Homalodisca vitripennis]
MTEVVDRGSSGSVVHNSRLHVYCTETEQDVNRAKLTFWLIRARSDQLNRITILLAIDIKRGKHKLHLCSRGEIERVRENERCVLCVGRGIQANHRAQDSLETERKSVVSDLYPSSSTTETARDRAASALVNGTRST